MRYKLLPLSIGLVVILAVLLVAPVRAQDNGPSLQSALPNSAAPASAAPLAPLGDMFTYQGFLTTSGSPAQGQFDFRFRMFNAAAGGSQVGGDKLANDVQVRKGVFTVQLNYGAEDIDSSVFFGDARWIEVAVRPGASGGAYTALSPRQELTATPYAFSLYPDANVQGSVEGGNAIFATNTAASGESYGLRGDSASTAGRGVSGRATAASGTTYGVYGQSVSPNGTGVYGIGVRGVEGRSSAGGTNSYGVLGESTANSGTGVYGRANTGSNAYGVWGASTSGYAGWFEGKVRVTGNLQKGGGSFIIDHPLDPENKYLYHSFVESPDMMNIYNGNVTLGASGAAWVDLPAWFEALNRDFRYQLTAIGAPGPNLYIATPVENNRFQIAGGQPGAQVSWQVTGIRQDAYANLHRIPVEEDKPASERGTYLHPDAFGQPAAKGVNYERVQQAEQNASDAAQGAGQ